MTVGPTLRLRQQLLVHVLHLSTVLEVVDAENLRLVRVLLVSGFKQCNAVGDLLGEQVNVTLHDGCLDGVCTNRDPKPLAYLLVDVHEPFIGQLHDLIAQGDAEAAHGHQRFHKTTHDCLVVAAAVVYKRPVEWDIARGVLGRLAVRLVLVVAPAAQRVGQYGGVKGQLLLDMQRTYHLLLGVV